jgi:hypothetical protein
MGETLNDYFSYGKSIHSRNMKTADNRTVYNIAYISAEYVQVTMN